MTDGRNRGRGRGRGWRLTAKLLVCAKERTVPLSEGGAWQMRRGSGQEEREGEGTGFWHLEPDNGSC